MNASDRVPHVWQRYFSRRRSTLFSIGHVGSHLIKWKIVQISTFLLNNASPDMEVVPG